MAVLKTRGPAGWDMRLEDAAVWATLFLMVVSYVAVGGDGVSTLTFASAFAAIALSLC